jgi:cold shock CspA family protein
MVKWYNGDRGLASSCPTAAARTSSRMPSALKRAEILGLAESQRIVVDMVEGRKATAWLASYA